MAMTAELLIIFLRDFTIFFAIYLIVTLSLNLEYGYGGVSNFGKVLAVAGGAFTVGFFPGRLAVWLFNIGTAEYNGLTDYATLEWHATIVNEVNKALVANPALSLAIFFATLIVAALVGAVLGYIASYPAIRLREDYLAIMLLAMGEAIRVIGHNYTPIIRGNIGCMVPDHFGWAEEIMSVGMNVFVTVLLWSLPVGLISLALCFVVLKRRRVKFWPRGFLLSLTAFLAGWIVCIVSTYPFASPLVCTRVCELLLSRYMIVLYFIVGVCLVVLFYLERLVRTPLGRMLRATRDNEDVAESLGKDVTSIRMKVIMIASMIGAIAGALDAFKAGGIIAAMYHRQTWTFWPWVMVILGGAANNVGVVVGAFAFTALRRLIDFFKEFLDPLVPFSVVWLEPLLLGTMLILILMYRPGGLIPEKPTPTLSSKKLEKIVSLRTDSSSKIEDYTSSG